MAWVGFLFRPVQALRKRNLRQIGAIVLADRYRIDRSRELIGGELPLQELSVRGARIDPDRPVAALAMAEYLGREEFDAVIAVGIEQGIVPSKVEGSAALVATLEQRSIREVYLSFTRAKFQLIVANRYRSVPSAFLTHARKVGSFRNDDECRSSCDARKDDPSGLLATHP